MNRHLTQHPVGNRALGIGVENVIAVVVVAARLISTRVQTTALELLSDRIGIEILDPPRDVVDHPRERWQTLTGLAHRLSAVSDDDASDVSDS